MTTVEIMEQAQVFASAWGLVGSRFDNGDEIDNANGQKADLRVLVDALEKDLNEWKDAYLQAAGAQTENIDLHQQIEALAKDACRYAFVRTADKVSISREAAKNPLAYDEAIDKAIEAAQAEQA